MMTPDTTSYMVAGFIVIIVSIVSYVLSLWLRLRAIERKNKK